MILYLLRHGDAGDSLLSPTQDNARKLTSVGKEKTRAVVRAAKAMKYPAPMAIVSSPLTRAQETANIAMEEFGPMAHFEETRVLVPSAEMEVTMAYIMMMSEKYDSLMLVGHDPHMTSLASLLVSGSTRPAVEMKKSALAVFEITQPDAMRMRGYLKCLLPPKISQV
jgi:phosphohistidine phosphatase